MHPNTMKCTKTRDLDPMQWIGRIYCESFRYDFMTCTFALIVPVEPVSHRVYYRNKTIPNASEHCEIRQNISLGSYGLDQVRSLRKIPTRLRGTNFCTNCTNSARFAPSFTAVIKQSQMHLNTMKCAKTGVLGPMGSIGLRKIRRDFVAQTFALIAPFQYVLQQVSCSYETIQNAPKYYETHRNIGIGSKVVDWLCSLQKISTRLRGMNFCNNCTSSTHFAPSSMY